MPRVPFEHNLPDPLAAVMQSSPGGIYRRADLQVHTPADIGFRPKMSTSTPAERQALAETYLGAARERGLEIVGITEHNDVSWIEVLREAAVDLHITVLPGFEVESQEGIHVLCLFDPETEVHHLEETLVGLGLTKARRTGKHPVQAKRHFRELVSFIQEEAGGICIAAHIERDKGLLHAVREGARVELWKTPDLLAAQISRPPEEITSGNGRIIRGEDPNYDRDRPLAYLLTSDSRSPDDIGKVSTWIKMDQVTVEGLRQAFLDPESRIAFGNPHEGRRGGRLVAAAWQGDFVDGVAFRVNPELNCVIGGKGTGKSTLLETIRYAFDLDYRTEEVGRAARDLREFAFRSGSKVSLIIETDAPARKRYVIERTAPHAPVVRELSGQPRPDLTPGALLNPCVYGQKEIFGVAQDESARLGLLDAFAAPSLRSIQDRERGILERCVQNGQAILDLQRRLDESDARLAELPGLEEWRRRFHEHGFQELLHERRQLDREARLLNGVVASLVERRDALVRLEAEYPPLETSLPDAVVAESSMTELFERLERHLNQLDQHWSKGLMALTQQLEAATDETQQILSEWQRLRAARQQDFDAALRELQARMPDVDPERYLDVERRIEQLTPLKSSVKNLRDQANKAREEREVLLVELNEVRGEKHRARQKAADSLNLALGGDLLVELTYQGDRESFVNRLVALRTGARADSLRRMVRHPDFTPSEFASTLRGGSLTGKFGLPEGQVAVLERSISEEALLGLEVDELPDQVELKLNIGLRGTPDYRALAKLSPGQKSTAILLLIMQESDDPLIIDQPEDDLDNRFIYDDVVKRLRKAKPNRQFLIATHNANIPVLGDAEQIVVLDAEEKANRVGVGSFVRTNGSIDSEQVRLAAEQILEGGPEAFALRRAKYGF